MNKSFLKYIQKFFPEFDSSGKLVIDSRQASKGDIFFAFEGANTDGRLYIDDVIAKGGYAVYDDRNLKTLIPESDKVYLVENVHSTIVNIVKQYILDLKKSGTKIIGITGSSGKTFTKNAITQILRNAGFGAMSTKGNFNTEFGLLLSLSSAPDQLDYLILELGISKSGDMDLLGSIVMPDLALILNISNAHAGNFSENEIEGRRLLIQEKLKLIQYSEKIVAHGDLRESIKYYYPNIDLEYYNTDQVHLEVANTLHASGKFHVNTSTLDVECPNLFGAHYLENLLGISVLLQNIISLDQFLAYSKDLQAESGRGVLISGLSHNQTQFKLYDSSYNANPGPYGSMIRELEVMRKFKNNGYEVMLILGECREIPANSIKDLHQEILDFAHKITDNVVCIGKSWPSCLVEEINSVNVNEIVYDILRQIPNNGVLFVKGSNGTGLYKYFVPELKKSCIN
jgi:UDP-N-acetylmuramoyl-tripeptide--D-alanyl-D-alanine ligase